MDDPRDRRRQRVGRDVNLVLITSRRCSDALYLVPRLHTLRLRCRLKFDDIVFGELLLYSCANLSLTDVSYGVPIRCLYFRQCLRCRTGAGNVTSSRSFTTIFNLLKSCPEYTGTVATFDIDPPLQFMYFLFMVPLERLLVSCNLRHPPVMAAHIQTCLAPGILSAYSRSP
ncbi:hypothetical protein B0H12DRAFT_1122790 [Mycena haematopus]|nr:hypothetical protein B0H12DRAFT_1122790 [Mycena haematopus]